MGREYRTLKVYKCALSRPLQAHLGLDLDVEVIQIFFRGLYKVRPPCRTIPVEADWPLEAVLIFLKGEPFEPLSHASDTNVLLKTLLLVLLASGRRSSEIANLSGVVLREGDRVWLRWRSAFRAKWDSERFVPECPSIERLQSEVLGSELLCPVRVLDVWLARKASAGFSLPVRTDYLWPFPQGRLDRMFKQLLESFFVRTGITRPSRLGMHTFRKLAATLSALLVTSGEDKKRLASRMGVSSYGTLVGHYIFGAPSLNFPVVVPLGVLHPRVAAPHDDVDT